MTDAPPFTERQLENYADALFWGLSIGRPRPLRRGDIVLIRFHSAALPLAEILYGRVLEKGMHPVVRQMGSAGMEKIFYALAGNRQLDFRQPGHDVMLESISAGIFINAPESITHLADVDPARIGRAARAAKPFRDILNRREEAGDFGWTLCVYPTPELARHAGLSPAEYAGQIADACFLNEEKPLEKWREIHRKGKAIKKWLNSLTIETLHVAAEGIDLRLTPGANRRWIGISGRNIPSFEIFLSPDWRGAEGHYFADQPSFRNGNYVEGARLVFKKGRLAEATADKGEAFLRQQAAMDPGAGRVGEFSLTDRRFSRIGRFMANTLFDENFGGPHGNCHLALGSAYSNSYDGDLALLTPDLKKRLGFNDSALHWDLVNTTPKKVTARLAGGENVVIYEEGEFRM